MAASGVTIKSNAGRARKAAKAPEASTPLIDAFCDQVWLQDGLAATSLASYRRDLERWAEWLDPAREDVAELIAPTPSELVETLELRPVSTAVNNVANNGPELMARAEAVSEPADQPALF